MPTKKPRLAITLEPEHYQTLQRLAKAQGGSMASIVSEMLSDMAPMLSKVADALEAAGKAQAGMRATLIGAAEKAEKDMLPLAEAAIAQFEHFAHELGRITDTAGDGPAAGLLAPTPRGARGRRLRAAAASGPRPVITGATNSGSRVIRAKKGGKH